MEPTLKVRGVSKNYGKIVALDNVDFEIYPGEVVGLVGDNGAGKSTLIKILSGAIQPDSGTIELDGRTVAFHSPADSRQLGVETVYQDLALAPHLNIEENIFLGRERLRSGWTRIFGAVDKTFMAQEAQRYLDSLHVHVPSLKVPVAELSGGQRQAVAVARAAAWGKKLVILDEPTNHLGVEEVDMVLKLIRNVSAQGIPVIFISHTLPHVLEVTDRIEVMRLGKKVASLKTAEANLNEVVSWITGSKEEAS
ncbi:ATP-binding cassette domain-containing protein [Alicyclobacillus cycloheptanicus]|uniref:ABC-type sugar transport system ATPase subunit n=1 Tax=Alicyclobacillus cycloheptanicus TaxID=1457 RepID=A0ABT9XHV9_9BACL|nr:ATP-binding cassette domain-containing protein [Alicyclobacillus cycloheptanicus]MDQ0189897.1 ABC-type sugar transport system ATPase subunit [Alicyclobacillus cycloheptanicus]